MPLSFLSFLSFFFLFLFFLRRDICLYSRSHRGPSKKETTVCVFMCVCVRKSRRECKGGCFRANDAPRTNLGIKSFLKLHK